MYLAHKFKKNQKLGRLRIIKRITNDHYGGTRWLCICDCGKKMITNGTPLGDGRTKSCGCLSRTNLEKGRQKGILWSKRLAREELSIRRHISKISHPIKIGEIPNQIVQMYFAYYLMRRISKGNPKFIEYARGWVREDNL